MAREPGASTPGPLSPYVTLGAVRYAVRRAPPPRVCPCRCCSEEAVAACLGRAKPDRRTLERLRPRLVRGARDERPSRHQRLQDLTKRLLPRGNSTPLVSPPQPPPPPPPPPPHSAPVLPPIPPPRSRHRHSPTRGVSVDRYENDIFDTEKITLPRAESRLIVGSYAQKTIPYRSASFSHGDCTQEKYYRAANRLPSIFDFGNKSEKKLGVERAGSSCTRNDESASLATEETITEGGSVASVDSAVGSDEGLLAHASPAPRSPPPDAPHKQLGTRSLTHPLPRRVPPVREEGSTAAGGSLPVLMAPRILHELREESDGSQADSAQAHSEGTSPLEPAQPFAFPPLPDPPPNACVNVDCECENFPIDRWEDSANSIASTVPVPVYECIVKQWSKELPPDEPPRLDAASDVSLDKDKEDETITSEKVAHLLKAVKNTNTPAPIGIRERRRQPHDKKRRKGIYITTASDDGGEESPPVNGCKRENSDASLQEMRLSAETRTSSLLGDKSDDSCANGPPSPCEAPVQMWPRTEDLRTRRARFSQQSSDERDDDSFRMRRKYGLASRGDSPSEAESDSCSRDRTASPSPFSPSDNSDVEAKRQQCLKGPYGRNLEPPSTRSVEVSWRSSSDATVPVGRKISVGATPTVGTRPKGTTHKRATSSPSKLAGVRPGADLLAELLRGSSEALSNTATFDNVILTMHQHNVLLVVYSSNKVLEEYITLNHMKKIENRDIENGVYLPHHAVIKMERETSKVRVVYDASCKGSNGVSLNDELLTGPPLLEDLRAILIRWRTYKIAFVADVEKMYRQILVNDEHTNYQRIVWRPDPTGPIEDFKLLTVTFGTSSAPYLAIKTLRQVAIDEGSDYPEAKKMILRDFYMDDLLSGTDEEDQAIEIQKQITQILSSGGFPLKKWCSNCEEFMKALDRQQKREELQAIEIKHKESVKTLGITWEVQKDKLLISNNIKESDEATMTKRSVLSEIASIYDPMGWIAPSVIIAKIFMQRLWKKGISWDEELPTEMKREWLQYKKELPSLKEVSLDRWIHTTKKSTLQLHGFADASALAYAAVIYSRVINEDGEVKVSLVTAKTKISPIKTVSLPRLELLAATLLSKVLKQVCETLEVQLSNVYAYSDSQVTLAWIHGDPIKWKPFVKNRVVEITDILDPSHWFYVQTKQNPADPASRGVMPAKLMSTEIWWNGPEMLKERELRLEKGTPLETALEKKKNIVTFTTSTSTTNENEEQLTFLKRFSSLQKLTRVVAYCRRWLRVIDKEKDNLPSYLTHEERNDALTICIRMSQEVEFADEIEDLKKERNLKPKSSLIALSPFLDEKNVLRVGGRLKHANMEFVRKHPIIISKNNVLLPLILREAHAKTLHGPPQMMITYLRSKYWLINAANSVKRFVRECVTCLRQSAKNREQKMGDLPESRVKPCRPFLITGVDFAGPINVRMSKGRGAKSYKAYICLFVCMCTKALHLELVSDMTTQAFLAAFKRFVSRRGHVAEMWSDHGTSFIGAEKELLEMWSQGKSSVPNEFLSMLDKEGTKWKYIPPGAPNFGGLWEAGVKSTKHHLKRIVGDTTLTFEELSTILIEIEACLNSRPLSPISDHPEDLEPLTPGHLLLGEPTVLIPSEDLQGVKMNRLDRWF